MRFSRSQKYTISALWVALLLWLYALSRFLGWRLNVHGGPFQLLVIPIPLYALYKVLEYSIDQNQFDFPPWMYRTVLSIAFFIGLVMAFDVILFALSFFASSQTLFLRSEPAVYRMPRSLFMALSVCLSAFAAWLVWSLARKKKGEVDPRPS